MNYLFKKNSKSNRARGFSICSFSKNSTKSLQLRTFLYIIRKRIQQCDNYPIRITISSRQEHLLIKQTKKRQSGQLKQMNL